MRLLDWFIAPQPEIPPAPRERAPGHAHREERGRTLAARAAEQWGVVDLADLTELGYTRSAISRRVAAGALHRVHRGVYAVGHARLAPQGRWLAAVRACGREAVLSHRSAAALHGIRTTARASVEVTAPGGRRGARTGIDLHVARLDAEDRDAVDGIPCTAVARTLVDLGDVIGVRAVERAIEEALVAGRLDVASLRATARRRFGRPGAARVLALLDGWTGGSPTESAFEEALLAATERAGLPRPRCQHPFGRFRLDAAWPAQRVAVECDGFAFHATRSAFDRDRAKEAALDAAGWHLIRLGWPQLQADPEAVVARIARALARGSAPT